MKTPTRSGPESVFHPGEQAIQDHVGVRARIDAWGRRVVRPCLPEQHRDFYAALPFVVVAARDADARPWVTLLSGAPGFVHSPDPGHLEIESLPVPGDPLHATLEPGDDLGLLGIEFEQRRRNRANGRVESRGSGGLRLRVDQSFGNCPQYIGERPWHAVDATTLRPNSRRALRLDRAARRWIEGADTFFIGSGWAGDGGEEPRFGMDASHRGGAPGFVEVRDDRTLVFPDYAGNHHYNTLGNLLLDPRVALTFVDFEHGGLLQLSGTARIDLDPPTSPRHPGALRLITVEIDAVVRIDDALALRWSEPAAAAHDLVVTRRVRETADVASFVLAAANGVLPAVRAGQHLPLELAVDGGPSAVTRTYSLSGAPDAGTWRITVKREPQGLVSGFLHDAVDVGTRIRARAPGGDFVLRPGTHPVLLVSAGTGITPMVAMLHELAATDPDRPVHFVHGARDGAHVPLGEEVDALVARLPNARLHRFLSRPGPPGEPRPEHRDETRHEAGDVLRTGAGHRPRDRVRTVTGRIDRQGLAQLGIAVDAEAWLCGPAGFLADTSAALEALGIAPARIHAETFGSAPGRSVRADT